MKHSLIAFLFLLTGCISEAPKKGARYQNFLNSGNLTQSGGNTTTGAPSETQGGTRTGTQSGSQTGTASESQSGSSGAIELGSQKADEPSSPTAFAPTSLCANGVDDNGDGVADEPGSQLRRTIKLPHLSQPKLHPVAVINGKALLTNNMTGFGGFIHRPMAHVVDLATGSEEQKFVPFHPTANDAWLNNWEEYIGSSALNDRIQAGNVPAASLCDISQATEVHAISVYEGHPLHVKVNTGKCVALALSAYHSTNWVVETFNGSAVATVLLHTAESSEVKGIPSSRISKLPSSAVGFYNGPRLFTYAKDRLRLTRGTATQKYKARGFLVGLPDASLTESYWSHDDLQNWLSSDVVISRQSAFLTFSGITFHDAPCSPPKTCAVPPPTDIEGYLASWTPGSKNEFRYAKLPHGLHQADNKVFDPSSNYLFATASGPGTPYQIIKINPSNLNVELSQAMYPDSTARHGVIAESRLPTTMPHRLLVKGTYLYLISQVYSVVENRSRIGIEVAIFRTDTLASVKRRRFYVGIDYHLNHVPGEMFSGEVSFAPSVDFKEGYLVTGVMNVDPVSTYQNWKKYLLTLDLENLEIISSALWQAESGEQYPTPSEIVVDSGRARLLMLAPPHARLANPFDIFEIVDRVPRLIAKPNLQPIRYDSLHAKVLGFDMAAIPSAAATVEVDTGRKQSLPNESIYEQIYSFSSAPKFKNINPETLYSFERISEAVGQYGTTHYPGIREVILCNP